MASPLDHYLPIRTILVDGVVVEGVSRLDVDSATLTATLSEDGKTLYLESVGGGGGPDPSNDPPSNLGTPSAGVSTRYMRADAVVGHGDLGGASLHAVADGSTAGFQSAAHYSLCAAIAAGTYDPTFDDVVCDALTAGAVGCTTVTASSTIQGTTITGTTSVVTPAVSAASGTFSVGTTGVTALVCGRSAATCQVIASTLYEQADQVYRRTTSGTNRRVDVVSTAYSETYDSSVTSVTDAWSQASSGAGGTRIISGQQGAAGSVGGNIEIIPGAGGTPGTNLAGKVFVRQGQLVSGSTNTFEFWDSTAAYLTINKVSSSFANLVVAGSYQIQAASGAIWQIASQNIFRASSTNFFDQASIYWRNASSATKRIDTVADAFAMTYDAAVTSVTDALGAAATTRETTWASGTAAARMSERHATVTTTDATVTTCGTVTITNDRVQVVTAIVVGYQNNTTVAGYEIKAVFRAASGTATRVAAPTVVVLGEDSAGWDVTMDASGATARVRVTGAAATTITWETYFTAHYGKAA